MKLRCAICNKPLTGNQRKFCSRQCKCADTNNRFQSYETQKVRGAQRRRELITLRGGKCSRCGYARNQAAIAFHHTDPTTKSFCVDIRQCSNRSMSVLVAEANKCILLCHNCHNEVEHPSLSLSPPL